MNFKMWGVIEISATSIRSRGYILLTGYWKVRFHKIPQLNEFSERRILSQVNKYLFRALKKCYALYVWRRWNVMSGDIGGKMSNCLL